MPLQDGLPGSGHLQRLLGGASWNEGTSYPIQSGHGCIGCSEAGFWDNGPFYQHLPSFPGFGIESTADTIGTAVGVATLAGVAAHAVVTNIRKQQRDRGSAR